MRGKLGKVGSRRLLETGVLLSILLIFAMTGLSVVMVGAHNYKRIGEDMEENFKARTPMAYLANKVRQNDRENAIEIRDLEGTSALVLKETTAGYTYETWIYTHEGKLKEAYIEAGDPLTLADGMVVMDLEELVVTWQGESLVMRVQTDEETYYEMTVQPRTHQRKGGA